MITLTQEHNPAAAPAPPLMVDLRIPVRGTSLPADHGYGLFSALAHLAPSLHTNPHVGILTVAGMGDKQGKIFLTRHAHLRIRLPIESVRSVYGLAGKRLRVGNQEIQLGIPEIFTLKASSSLKARIVTIKGYLETEGFEQAAQKQINTLGITGEVRVLRDKNGMPLRKTLKIKSSTIVGFSTIVRALSDADSIRLQQVGLGGRRRMGCGFFLPEQE